MRQGNQNMLHLGRFTQPQHIQLLQELQQAKQSITKFCQQSAGMINNKIEKQSEYLEKLLNIHNLDRLTAQQKVNQLTTEYETIQNKFQDMQNTIKLKQFILQMAEKDVKSQEQILEVWGTTKTQLQQILNKTITELNQAEIKMNQQQNYGEISPISGSNNISYVASDLRVYNNKRMSRTLSSKNNQKGNFKHVEINAESSQIILRVQSSKIYEFYMYFDHNEEKFCLRSSIPKLKAKDILAVKNFNVHQNINRLLEDFRQLLEKQYEENI